MQKIVLNKKRILIIALTFIFIVGGLLSYKIIFKRDKYENEGINMTEEEKEVVGKVIELAESKVGFQYVWGGKGELMTEERLNELISYYGDSYYPLDKETYIGSQAFDCSGLTYWTYREVTGEEIGYSTFDQEDILQGYEVNKEDIQPGDLVFSSTNGTGNVSHVGIYIGDDQMIHSPKPGENVKIVNINTSYWNKVFLHAKRVL